MRSRQPRASSTASARRRARYRRPANSTGPSRSRRSVLHLVQELRGICSNRSAVAWGAPLIRWSDDGAIVLAARPIASFLAKLFADSAYAGSIFHTALGKVLPNLETEIVKRSDRAKGFVPLPKRWIVERTIAWLNLAADWPRIGRISIATLSPS